MPSVGQFPVRIWQGLVALFLVGWTAALFLERLASGASFRLVDIAYILPLLLFFALHQERTVLALAVRNPVLLVRMLSSGHERRRALLGLGLMGFLVSGLAVGALYSILAPNVLSALVGPEQANSHSYGIIAIAAAAAGAAYLWARQFRNVP